MKHEPPTIRELRLIPLRLVPAERLEQIAERIAKAFGQPEVTWRDRIDALNLFEKHSKR